MKEATWANVPRSRYELGKPERIHQENGCTKGTTAYTPLRTFVVVDVKVEPVQLRPEGVSTPEIRVHKDRESLGFRQIGCSMSERRPSLPIENAAEIMPVLINRTGETTEEIIA